MRFSDWESFFKVENNSLELTRIFKESFKDQRWAWEESVRAEKRDRDAEREKETFRRQRHHQSQLMMALTPKRLFLSLCISISLLRSYTFFSRSPLVFKTLFDWESSCALYAGRRHAWCTMHARQSSHHDRQVYAALLLVRQSPEFCRFRCNLRRTSWAFRVVREGHPIPESTCWTSPIVIQPVEKRPFWSNGKKHVFLWKLAPAQEKDWAKGYPKVSPILPFLLPVMLHLWQHAFLAFGEEFPGWNLKSS